MIDLEKAIKEKIKQEKDAFLPKWVKPEEVDNLILENFIAYVSNGELRSFARIDIYDAESLEMDWFWIKDKGRGRTDEYFFIFWVFNQLFQYSKKVYSNFFEHIYTPVVKFSKRKIKRYITAYRFRSVEFNLDNNLKWNGIYAYLTFGENYIGYSKVVYDIYLKTGVPFLVVDLPLPPLGRDFQAYYEVEVDREKALEKFRKISKKHKLKGDVHFINFKLLNLEIT